MSLSLIILVFMFIGAGAGFLAGLFGVGGGVLVVPLLLIVFRHVNLPTLDIMYLVIATSLAVMIVSAAFSLYWHQQKEPLRLRLMMSLLPGMVIGVVIGSLLSHAVPSHWLRYLFSFLLVAISVRLFLAIKPKPERTLPGWPIRTLFTGFVGLMSGLLGIGGGTLLVPFLVSGNVPIRQTTACAAATSLVAATVGTISYLLLAHAQSIHLPYCIGYIYWPAFLSIASVSSFSSAWGVRLSYRLSLRRLTRFFAVFLLLVALHLFFGGI